MSWAVTGAGWAVALLVAISASSCGGTPTDALSDVSEPPASATSSPSSPEPVRSGTSSPPGAALWPSCVGVEYQPTSWTPNCGDAGSSLDQISFDAWGPEEAHGRAVFRVTKGGPYFEQPVTFVLDQPVPTPDYGRVFGRLTITFGPTRGPSGQPRDVVDLLDVLETARFIDAQPVPTCGEGECAPGPEAS